MTEYTEIKKDQEPTVYLLQEIPGTSIGRPKFNIMGALKYGKIKVLLKEHAQIVLSAGPVHRELVKKLKDVKSHDYIILTGDPSIIYETGKILHDRKITQLKWDRQEKVYYPVPNFNPNEREETYE